MTATQDGGPAFPFQFEDMGGHPRFRQSFGLSKRDYFAGQAMQALIAGNCADASCISLGNAKDAYAMADAMLLARGSAS